MPPDTEHSKSNGLSALPQPSSRPRRAIYNYAKRARRTASLLARIAPRRCSWCVSRRETLPERDERARETSARRTSSHSHVSRSRRARDAPASGTRHSIGLRTLSRFHLGGRWSPSRRRTLRARFSLLCTILPAAAAATNVESPNDRGYFRDAAAHRNTIISREYP